MEQVFKDRIPHWSMSREFLEEAEKLGWFHEKDRALNHDLCPECYRVKAS
jgi:hypothetical protein